MDKTPSLGRNAPSQGATTPSRSTTPMDALSPSRGGRRSGEGEEGGRGSGLSSLEEEAGQGEGGASPQPNQVRVYLSPTGFNRARSMQ